MNTRRLPNARCSAFPTTSSARSRRLCHVKSGESGEDEIDSALRQRLARFKRPRAVKFVDDFPKTPIGKIQKNILREPYWQGREKKI